MYKKTVLCAVVIALASISMGCKKQSKKVVIASKPMTEQFIIAEMLKALIENETDIMVVHKQGIGGGTSNIHPAMVKGEIDIYPEYTGTGWMFVLKEKMINDPHKLYENVKKLYKEKYGIIWSDLYGFNNTFGLGIKKDIAEKYNLKSYSDLAAKSKMFTLGAEYDFYEREDGFPGLEKKYEFNFKRKVELDIGLKYQAVGTGEVDLINIFSTDGRLKEFNLVVLVDDKNFFPSYFCATLIREKTLQNYPELGKIINKLTGKISNDEMTNLNYLVEIKKQDAKDVAVDFLNQKGLL